jgi:hypothetical protein
MAKVLPYHTINLEEGAGHRNVYHDHDDCSDGKRILKKDWRSGTANRPRCDECKRLG